VSGKGEQKGRNCRERVSSSNSRRTSTVRKHNTGGWKREVEKKIEK